MEETGSVSSSCSSEKKREMVHRDAADERLDHPVLEQEALCQKRACSPCHGLIFREHGGENPDTLPCNATNDVPFPRRAASFTTVLLPHHLSSGSRGKARRAVASHLDDGTPPQATDPSGDGWPEQSRFRLMRNERVQCRKRPPWCISASSHRVLNTCSRSGS